MMLDDIQTWWQVPSIVHFCKMFSHISNDIFPIDINEFERAIVDDSILLEDMAIRFIKICGCYDQSSKKWWSYMKDLFQTKCFVYNFDYSLDSVSYFDELTRKQKVDALYILCHIVLDVEHIQYKIYHKPEIWKELNVKPLGYDLKNSVYWYFGSTRLYKEDFENMFDLSANSTMLQNTTQNNSNSSNIGIHNKSFLSESYPSGIVGPGKWNMICDDNYSSWFSLADNTEYSKNVMVRSLHKSVCDIINKLPQVKRKKMSYKYLVKQPKPSRSLRSMLKVDYNELLENSDIIEQEQDLQQLNVSQTKNDDSIIPYLPKTRRNADLSENIKRSSNRTSMRLQFKNVNTIMNRNTVEINEKLSKVDQNGLKHKDQVNGICHGQENTPNLYKFNTKLRTLENVRNSIRLKESKISSLNW